MDQDLLLEGNISVKAALLAKVPYRLRGYC